MSAYAPATEGTNRVLPPLHHHVTIQGKIVELKYCCMFFHNNLTHIATIDTCHVYRPPRASHCPQCDNCVVRIYVMFRRV